ncbi:MAG: DPP IV N-terminal domain-containing protein [Maricaulaceae bacterium]
MRAISYTALLAALCLSVTACAPNAEAPETQASYLTLTPGPGKLTPERLYAAPSINGSTLRRASISPDGKIVTVLQGRKTDATQQDLWAYDLENGKGRLLVSSTDLLGAPETLSDEEKNRRERAREYGQGIISYSWVGENLIMFPLGGDLYLYDLATQSSRQVTATKAFETDPKVSEDGRFVAYVRENELFLTDLETGLERQLSEGASETVRNGLASFVVQEELDRSTGYWLSPNANRIAYTQIDESAIAVESRIEFGPDGVENINQRYPFTGTENATVRLAITDRSGKYTVWADLGEDKDIYLTRVIWSPLGDALYVGILSRDHKTHSFLKIDPSTGSATPFHTETSSTWLNIGNDLHMLTNGSLLWSNEQSDKRRIYRLSEGRSPAAITPDSLLVNRLLCTNEKDGVLYVRGWQDSPLESHIFRVPLEGGEATQITQGEGRHSGSFDDGCTRYIGSFSNSDTPSQTRAFKADGTPLAWLNENALDQNHPYAQYKGAHITPEFGQIPAQDGTMMDYVLYKPLDLKAGEKRPAVTVVYGGPGVQRVSKGWGRHNFARMLAHHGFVVFTLDNRGATNRGKAFEDVLYRSMGRAEVTDQSTGAQWLAGQDFVDADKMGVFGWSYGGYMALHMLAQTDHYASGVSGAPVTEWELYDTAYTERYLGHPDPENANYTKGAYEDGSVFPYLDGLTEPMLLIHGMADDNVVFRHSIKLMDAMQKKGAQNMRLMTYPGEKHGFRKTENKVHRDRQVLEFFVETLGEK